jgi:hypothetical protein
VVYTAYDDCLLAASLFVCCIKYYLGDQIKEDEMGRAQGTHWGEGECIQASGGET